MATKDKYKHSEIIKGQSFSMSRTTIESAFYSNNVVKLDDLKEAYELAKKSPGTIVTDNDVFQPEKIGLKKGSKVLLFNDGETVGRFAGARVILGDINVDESEIAKVLREAVFHSRYKTMYHCSSYIGLDKDFMIKANLLIPKTYENTAYNWLLNFQYINEKYKKMYAVSKKISDEPDIFIYSDPDYKNDAFPDGLAYFDPKHNCACLLGMRYFGEHKKGTLTLAWSVANRNGYCSCHGGLKRMVKKNGDAYVLGVFGLSGSGKSTLTHAKHKGKFKVTVLHDDAYIISSKNGSTVALEPSYFDKTQDYPTTSKDNKFLITVQNCGVTLDNQNKKVLVTEDIRNGNGRAIKSKLWAPNRVDKMSEPINSIVWLMKDPSLPPVVKITDPVLASTLGATLATKRTSAEKLKKGVNMNDLVFEPYANPFRTYPLIEDYDKFKYLFKEKNVECYIINTGHFIDKKIPKEVTISIIEGIVEDTLKFTNFYKYKGIKTVNISGFIPNFNSKSYRNLLKKQMKDRHNYLLSLKKKNGGKDQLTSEANNKILDLVNVK